MAKKIEGYINLQVPAGTANPSPPIGPALGQRGVNIMEFCKAFNAATQDMEKNAPIPTKITVYADRSFTFETKSPPASYMIKKAMKIKSGSKEPGKNIIGPIKKLQLAEIAEAKMKDLNANDIEGASSVPCIWGKGGGRQARERFLANKAMCTCEGEVPSLEPARPPASRCMPGRRGPSGALQRPPASSSARHAPKSCLPKRAIDVNPHLPCGDRRSRLPCPRARVRCG